MNRFLSWWKKRKTHYLYIHYIPSDDECYRVMMIDKTHPEFDKYWKNLYNTTF